MLNICQKYVGPHAPSRGSCKVSWKILEEHNIFSIKNMLKKY